MKTRANINIDADAYDFASSYAAARGIALGAAVSELLRRVQQTSTSPSIAPPRLRKTSQGYLVVAKTGNIVTSEMVKDFAEDDLV